jgi:hypothetical protein
MKTFFLALLLAAACAGCATRYDVTLTNGQVVTTRGKPHLSPDKNEWLFTDASGKPDRVPAGNVSQVAPQSMDTDNPTKFNPVIGK